MRVARMLLASRIASAALLLAAVFWWVRSPRVSIPDASVSITAMLPSDAGDEASWVRPIHADSMASAIVAGNMFSHRRRPPSARYRPVSSTSPMDVGDEMAGGFPVETPPMNEPVSVVASDDVPKLFGTMLSADGASALLRLDRRVAAPQLFREGDRAGGYRVVKISERAVTLAGTTGPLTLRLMTSEKDVP